MPHTVEEAYEVADAALAGDDAKLLDELGDLLFQSYFLALLLSERGAGDLEAVARGVHAKLVARHPHVFGDVEATTAGRVRENWERLKVEQEGREGVFHDVPGDAAGAAATRARCSAAPPRSASTTRTSAGALAELDEELRELRAELAGRARRRERARPARRGRARRRALRLRERRAAAERRPRARAARGRRSRFRERVERGASALAAADGEDWATLDLAEQDRYYDRAKESLR